MLLPYPEVCGPPWGGFQSLEFVWCLCRLFVAALSRPHPVRPENARKRSGCFVLVLRQLGVAIVLYQLDASEEARVPC